jgi:hypothetical protein
MSKTYAPLQVRSPCSQGHSVYLTPTQDLRITLPGATWTCVNSSESPYIYIESSYVDSKKNTVYEIKQINDLTGLVRDCAFFLGKLSFKNHDPENKHHQNSLVYVYAHESTQNYCLKSGRISVLNPSKQTVKISLGQILETIVTFKASILPNKYEPKWSILPSQDNNFSKHIKILRTELFGLDVPEAYDTFKFSENHPLYSVKNWNTSHIPINPSVSKLHETYVKTKLPVEHNVQFHIWMYVNPDMKLSLIDECIKKNIELVNIGGLFLAYGEKVWSVFPSVSYRSLKDDLVDRTNAQADGVKPVFNTHQKVYLSTATFNPNPNDSIEIPKGSGHIIEVMSAEFLTRQSDITWEIDRPISPNENLEVTKLAPRKVNSSIIERFYLAPKNEIFEQQNVVDKLSKNQKIYLGFFGISGSNSRFTLKRSLAIWLSNKPKVIETPTCELPSSVLGHRRKKKRHTEFESFSHLDDYYYNLSTSRHATFSGPLLPKKIKKLRFVELCNSFVFGTTSVRPMVLSVDNSKKNSLVPLETIKKNLTLIQNMRILNARKEDNVNVDKENIVTVSDFVHGDAIVVKPGDRLRVSLPLHENETPWVANTAVFGTTKNIVIESIEPITQESKFQNFLLGFFWRDLTVEKYGHHFIGAIRFSNNSSYMIVLFYIDVTKEFVCKGEFNSHSVEYLSMLREVSLMASAVKQKKTMDELMLKREQEKKVNHIQRIEDPNLSEKTTCVVVKNGDIFSIVITRRHGYVYSITAIPDYVKFVDVDPSDGRKAVWNFQIDTTNMKESSVERVVRIKAIDTSKLNADDNPILYGVSLVIVGHSISSI